MLIPGPYPKTSESLLVGLESLHFCLFYNSVNLSHTKVGAITIQTR